MPPRPLTKEKTLSQTPWPDKEREVEASVELHIKLAATRRQRLVVFLFPPTCHFDLSIAGTGPWRGKSGKRRQRQSIHNRHRRIGSFEEHSLVAPSEKTSLGTGNNKSKSPHATTYESPRYRLLGSHYMVEGAIDLIIHCYIFLLLCQIFPRERHGYRRVEDRRMHLVKNRAKRRVSWAPTLERDLRGKGGFVGGTP